MVGMIMREQHGIHAIDAVRDELQSQLGWCVEQEACAAGRLHHGTDPRALVARIGRSTDGTVATNLRHAETRSGAEEGQSHTVSTRMKFVVPGVSNGTPAVTTI